MPWGGRTFNPVQILLHLLTVPRIDSESSDIYQDEAVTEDEWRWKSGSGLKGQNFKEHSTVRNTFEDDKGHSFITISMKRNLFFIAKSFYEHHLLTVRSNSCLSKIVIIFTQQS